jgi:hypothetical protein
MRDKITVLFLAADPFRPGARRELDDEIRAVERAIQRGRARDTLELVASFATEARDVQEALRRHQPRIVHFSGHGGAPGGICLGDEQGRAQLVGRDALRGLLGVVDSVRIVVVDGTGTLATVEALREVADYTIGTNQRPGGGPAIAFAQAFYGALAAGRTVLAAFELGLGQRMLDGSPEDGMPVRRIRPGVDLDAALAPRPGEGAGDVHTRQARGSPGRYAVSRLQGRRWR